MSIFNEYLTGIDRELAIEEATFETEFVKYQTMFEMVQLQSEQMQRDAELKVLTESGTYDDLTYLMMEAENEVSGQKKGIISRIIDAIGRLFSTIGSKLQSIFSSKGDANQVVTVHGKVVEDGNALVTSINNAQNGMTKLRNGDFSGALDLLKAVKIPVIAAAATAGAGMAVKKYKKGELDNIVKKVQDAFGKLKSNFDAAKSKILGTSDGSQQDVQNGSLNIIQKLGSAVNKFVGMIQSAITKAITNVTGDGKDEQPRIGENKQPRIGENKPEENTNNNSSDNGGKPKNEKPTQVAKKVSHKNQWRILSNGVIQVLDKATKKWITPTDATPVPKDIEDIKKKYIASGTIQESVDELIDIIGLDLGYRYTVERSGDGIIITELDEESTQESAYNSIFGYNLSCEELLQESSDIFDEEIIELANLFASL